MSIAEELQQELMRVRREAIELHSADQVQEAIAKLAFAVTDAYSGKVPVMLTIMNGGMIFAAELVKRLDIPLEMDYLHASRYLGETTGGDVEWIVTPNASLAGRDVLIVDDILDVGTTLLSIIDACKAQGAASVKTCVLVDKQHDRKAKPGLKADFTALDAADHYLFGMGMDYKGFWRNAPGIYAVKEH
ncbi:MAG: hypoxanthine phosphoribosyltransferase [Alcanivorax sp.]|jgi:hypoxanthine phosphoribosyltransferase|uniref:hypoxanthine-guanine phosphoribosyltransferase n=1 Tax=unclassified Alcanivorax TaxID=2638842 RepID=UPI0039C477CA